MFRSQITHCLQLTLADKQEEEFPAEAHQYITFIQTPEFTLAWIPVKISFSQQSFPPTVHPSTSQLQRNTISPKHFLTWSWSFLLWLTATPNRLLFMHDRSSTKISNYSADVLYNILLSSLTVPLNHGSEQRPREASQTLAFSMPGIFSVLDPSMLARYNPVV